MVRLWGRPFSFAKTLSPHRYRASPLCVTSLELWSLGKSAIHYLITSPRPHVIINIRIRFYCVNLGNIYSAHTKFGALISEQFIFKVNAEIPEPTSWCLLKLDSVFDISLFATQILVQKWYTLRFPLIRPYIMSLPYFASWGCTVKNRTALPWDTYCKESWKSFRKTHVRVDPSQLLSCVTLGFFLYVCDSINCILWNYIH